MGEFWGGLCGDSYFGTEFTGTLGRNVVAGRLHILCGLPVGRAVSAQRVQDEKTDCALGKSQGNKSWFSPWTRRLALLPFGTKLVTPTIVSTV